MTFSSSNFLSIVVMIGDSIVSLFCVDFARVVVGMRAAKPMGGQRHRE